MSHSPAFLSVARHALRSRLRRRRVDAFSLVELLISVVLGAALVSAVFYGITSQIRGTQDTERAQRSRDDANRLNYLIQTEASEAVQLADPANAANLVIAGCPAYPNGDASPNGSTALFVLQIPLPSGNIDQRVADNIPATVPIYYYARNGDLHRCGPFIQRNGSLNLTVSNGAVAVVPAVISANTTLTRVTCNGTSSSTREVGYQLQFNDVSGGYQPPCAIARAKAFRVCDPGDPGECVN